MSETTKFAGVLFVADLDGMARFYQAVTGMQRTHVDEHHVVLESSSWQLVIHVMTGEPIPDSPPSVREDSYLKLCFPVENIAATRETVASLGGQIYSPEREWAARGFRACDGYDPEGNVIQVREPATDDAANLG